MAKQQQAEQNGHEEEIARYEKELAGYLQERIKPGLNSGTIPLLARSIAKEIAHREHPGGAADEAEVEDEHTAEAADDDSAEADDEHSAEADDDSAEADDEHSAEADDDSAEADDEDSAENGQSPDFEADMHELQAELGEDWILRFSVQNDDAWLTAEKDDGSQRVEAQTGDVISQTVELLNEGGGRSS